MNGDRLINTAVHLAARIPSFARHALVFSDTPYLAHVMNKLGVQTVQHGLSGLELPPAGEPGPFDAIVVSDCSVVAESLPAILDACLPLLAPTGYFVLGQRPQADESLQALNRPGLGAYSMFHDDGLDVFYKVRAEYNPVEHARSLMEQRQPQWAYEVLRLIPVPYLYDDGVRATVAAEQMVCLLQMDSEAQDGERLGRFAESNVLFYQVTALKTDAHLYYQCQADFWNRLGRPDMAARLLEAIDYASPNEDVRAQLSHYKGKRFHEEDCVPPEWNERSFRPRLLMVTHPRPHYGLDVLYNGLNQVLEPGRVVEFPFKPSLHGTAPRELSHYPCTFNWEAETRDIDQVVQMLEEGAFDAILFGDLEHDLDCVSARRIVHAAGVPVFLLDQQDECHNPRRDMYEFLDVEHVAGLFKREMIAGVDYGPDTWPMPFAYPDDRIPADVQGERTYDLFWAGHRRVGLRRLYLEWIERALDRPFNEQFDQEEYARRLMQSRIGINFFGYGFDTVRYWELPAHGCLLFSERLPICIPLNFEDGKSAVFFDTLEECEQKLRYWLDRPDEAAIITAEGYRHLRRHHTGSARARHLLGWMQSRL